MRHVSGRPIGMVMRVFILPLTATNGIAVNLKHPRGVEVVKKLAATADVMIESFRTGTTRSEEHTSELQSLMRISYAVFCLKKTTHYFTHSLSSTLFSTT